MKEILKFIAKLFAKLFTYPFYLAYLICIKFSDARECFPCFSQTFAQFPGKIGAYLRREFYKLTLDFCSDDCFIGYGSFFSTTEVEIHKGVYIGNLCSIGSAVIGEDTMLASRVSLISGLNQHGSKISEVSFKEQAGEYKQIQIAKNCWLGEGAIVAANLAENCIVAAGAVVIKDVAAGKKVIGNPAKVVENKKEDAS